MIRSKTLQRARRLCSFFEALRDPYQDAHRDGSRRTDIRNQLEDHRDHLS